MSKTTTSIEVRKMHGNTRRRLKSAFCRREVVHLWGERRGIVRHALLPCVWGDGRQIIAYRPINTRLGHFVIAGDSSWRLDRGDLHDYADEIMRLIEEHFGECGCDECRDGGKPWPHIFKQWPTPCFSGGSEWWKIATN